MYELGMNCLEFENVLPTILLENKLAQSIEHGYTTESPSEVSLSQGPKGF